VVVRTALNLAALYARVSAPFIPFAAEAIGAAFGEPWPPVWPGADVAAELSRLEPGRPVRAPDVLFPQAGRRADRRMGAAVRRAASPRT